MKSDAIGRITSARVLGQEVAELYDGTVFRVSDLSLRNRSVDMEELIIPGIDERRYASALS